MTVKFYRYYGNNRYSRAHLKAEAFPDFTRSVVRRYPEARSLIAGTRTAQVGPFRVRLNPNRSNRPIVPIVAEVSIRQPHSPCLFDTRAVIERQNTGLFEVNNRPYYLFYNRFPLASYHFLVVRPVAEGNSGLSQIFHSVEDVADAIEMHQLFPPLISFLFNSAAGGTTAAGASVNHFRLHVLPFGRSALASTKPAQLGLAFPGSALVEFGQVLSWPTRPRVFESKNPERLAAAVYAYLEILHDANNAYNLAFFRLSEGGERIVIIPRSRGTPQARFWPGAVNHTLGAGEQVGFFAGEFDQRAFTLMRSDPLKAQRILERQLRETTVTPHRLREFDRRFLGQGSED